MKREWARERDNESVIETDRQRERKWERENERDKKKVESRRYVQHQIVDQHLIIAGSVPLGQGLNRVIFSNEAGSNGSPLERNFIGSLFIFWHAEKMVRDSSLHYSNYFKHNYDQDKERIAK